MLAIAGAIDLAALWIYGVAGSSSFVPQYNASVLTSAAGSLSVLSLACFTCAIPPQTGWFARQPSRIFWVAIGASAVLELLWIFLPAFDRGGGEWPPLNGLSSLALWAALGWAICARPLKAALASRLAVLAGIGCVIATATALALSWSFNSTDLFSNPPQPWSIASRLAFFAVALSFGAQRS